MTLSVTWKPWKVSLMNASDVQCRLFRLDGQVKQGIDYMDEMPAMKAWRRLNAQKKLSPPQTNWFAKSKPIEELYDCDIDPHNIQNLAADSRFSSQLKKFGTATENWQLRIGDLGMVPEPVLMETINSMKVTVKNDKGATIATGFFGC